MSSTIVSGFTEVTLKDSSKFAEGRQDYFKYIMGKLEDVDTEPEIYGFAGTALIIGRKLENAGGYFTGTDSIARIVLPEGTATYDETTKELQFADDYQFGVFVHESSHFLHLVCDKGKFMSPEFEKLEPMCRAAEYGHHRSNTKYIEYEAGWRSLYSNRLYEMFEDDSLIFKMNLQNMLHYTKFNASEEFRKDLKAAKTPEELKKACEAHQGEYDEAVKNITKWSQLSTFVIGNKPEEK